jgi:hypothetical protein
LLRSTWHPRRPVGTVTDRIHFEDVVRPSVVDRAEQNRALGAIRSPVFQKEWMAGVMPAFGDDPCHVTVGDPRLFGAGGHRQRTSPCSVARNEAARAAWSGKAQIISLRARVVWVFGDSWYRRWLGQLNLGDPRIGPPKGQSMSIR